MLSSRPSDKPAALQRGKLALAEVGACLWSISRATLPHVLTWVSTRIALGGRRVFGLVPTCGVAELMILKKSNLQHFSGSTHQVRLVVIKVMFLSPSHLWCVVLVSVPKAGTPLVQQVLLPSPGSFLPMLISPMP